MTTINNAERYFSRQRGTSIAMNYDFTLKRLCVAKEDSWRGIVPTNVRFYGEPAIFAAKFPNGGDYRHLLAIGDESGKIALQDTTQRNCEPEERYLAGRVCHYSAVLDLEWVPGELRFISASGDFTAKLWALTTSEPVIIRRFTAHTGAVKTAAFRKNDSFVFATGGIDSAIIIWDTRTRVKRFVTRISETFLNPGGENLLLMRTFKIPRFVLSGSITGLAFKDENTLISCCAGGTIQVWDIRRNCIKRPSWSIDYTPNYKCFTNLFVDSLGSRVFANCTDNTIYCYNLHSYSPNPLARYRGLRNGSFYIKSCLSPDEQYLLSGSSDNKAYIWNLDYPATPLVGLSAHTSEVRCVAWGSTDDRPIVTCTDSARHKIWRIGPENPSASDIIENYRGRAEYIRNYTAS